MTCFWDNHSSGTFKNERLESQIIYNFGSNKLKVLNRIAKTVYGHLCQREENPLGLSIITLFRNCKCNLRVYSNMIKRGSHFWKPYLPWFYSLFPVFVNVYRYIKTNKIVCIIYLCFSLWSCQFYNGVDFMSFTVYIQIHRIHFCPI